MQLFEDLQIVLSANDKEIMALSDWLGYKRGCILLFQDEDELGVIGVALQKDLVKAKDYFLKLLQYKSYKKLVKVVEHYDRFNDVVFCFVSLPTSKGTDGGILITVVTRLPDYSSDRLLAGSKFY